MSSCHTDAPTLNRSKATSQTSGVNRRRISGDSSLAPSAGRMQEKVPDTRIRLEKRAPDRSLFAFHVTIEENAFAGGPAFGPIRFFFALSIPG